MQNRFYDKMSIALGLPDVASRSQWAPFGRCITPGAMARYIEGGEFYYGLESTFASLGAKVEPTPPEVAEAVQFLAGRMNARKAAENTDPSAIRDQKGSKQAKAWAVKQHLEEISLREAAAKHCGSNVHAPLSALYICSNLEPRGYPR